MSWLFSKNSEQNITSSTVPVDDAEFIAEMRKVDDEANAMRVQARLLRKIIQDAMFMTGADIWMNQTDPAIVSDAMDDVMTTVLQYSKHAEDGKTYILDSCSITLLVAYRLLNGLVEGIDRNLDPSREDSDDTIYL